MVCGPGCFHLEQAWCRDTRVMRCQTLGNRRERAVGHQEIGGVGHRLCRQLRTQMDVGRY